MTAVAAILTIGDELMLGDRMDTNGPWLSRALSLLGIDTLQRCSVKDDVQMIARIITQLATTCEILIITGGLGPTEDDRTREALARAMQEELVTDHEALASIEAWFAARKVHMPKANSVQAQLPKSASWIPNEHGTAPGMKATIGKCRILCLPGPPSELKPMFQQAIHEVISGLPCGAPRCTVEVHSWGMPESVAGEKIASIMRAPDPSVGILMGIHGITARVSSNDAEIVESVASEIEKRWSPWAYGRDTQTLSQRVGVLLQLQGGTLVTAESCTGGLIGELIVEPAGASEWFQGGWITYSNALKVEQLHVPQAMLDEYGAVSGQVAAAMCKGAISKSGATAALSTTGIAGPTGGSEDKPVGTVYIGCVVGDTVEIRLFQFSGDRTSIQRRTAYTALQMLRLHLRTESFSSMCWQKGGVIYC